MSADLDIADGRDYASNLDMAGYASLRPMHENPWNCEHFDIES